MTPAETEKALRALFKKLRPPARAICHFPKPPQKHEVCAWMMVPYLVTKLLIELARGKKEGYTLDSLIADLAEPAESKEFRFNILLEEFKPYGLEVLEKLQAYAAEQPGWSIAPNNFEGVRVNLDENHGNGWFLLRMSLHDPLLPLNIESDEAGGVLKIAKELSSFLLSCEGLDTDKFKAFIEA